MKGDGNLPAAYLEAVAHPSSSSSSSVGTSYLPVSGFRTGVWDVVPFGETDDEVMRVNTPVVFYHLSQDFSPTWESLPSWELAYTRVVPHAEALSNLILYN